MLLCVLIAASRGRGSADVGIASAFLRLSGRDWEITRTGHHGDCRPAAKDNTVLPTSSGLKDGDDIASRRRASFRAHRTRHLQETSQVDGPLRSTLRMAGRPFCMHVDTLSCLFYYLAIVNLQWTQNLVIQFSDSRLETKAV